MMSDHDFSKPQGTKWNFLEYQKIAKSKDHGDMFLESYGRYQWDLKVYIETLSHVKLNIGCGSDIRPKEEGWINIDGVDAPGVDVVADITNLDMFPTIWFPDGCADVIESNHAIEHISYNKSLAVLKEWARVLKPDGEMTIRCPDVGAMCILYAQGQWQLGRPGTERNIMNVLYGNHEDGEDGQYGFHRAGFDRKLMKEYLEEIGMYNVKVGESDRGHQFELLATCKKGILTNEE